MKRTLLLIALATLLLPKCILAQAPVDYRDVAVIVNTNSTNSVYIGNYFMKQRNIPSANLIQFAGDTTESIDSTKFEAMRATIENGLRKLKGINYLVTTKGCPLKVDHGGIYCDENAGTLYKTYGIILEWNRQINYSRCASFESELMLILGKDSVHIGLGDVLDVTTKDSLPRQHAYFEQAGHFYRSMYDIFLVTRLDGPLRKDVKNVIDRSGPNTLVNKDSALFVFDNIPYASIPDTQLNHSFLHTYNILKNRGWKIKYDSTLSLIDSQRNVLGYFSWGNNDPTYNLFLKNKKVLMNTFYNASIATTYYSYAGKTFTPGGTGYAATIAPFIAKGLTGGIGHVNEPFSFAMAEPMVLFGKYTDSRPDRRYNLAESYYSANATMSWMTTIVGDPKTSIITAIPAKPSVTLDTITKICENSSRVINSSGNLAGNYNWFSTDTTTLKASGSYMDSTNTNWVASGKSFTVPATLKPGKYTYTYVNENISGRSFKQVTFNVVLCTGIDASEAPKSTMEIYPNPAHNMFTVSYEGLNYQQAVLIITDVMGREVYTRNFSNANDFKQDINLDGKPSGIYFISLTTGSQRLVSKLILK